MTERHGSLPVELRTELPGDAAAIVELHREAFEHDGPVRPRGAARGPRRAGVDRRRRAPHGDAVAGLVLDLLATIPPHDRLSLVATLDESIVGHILFTGGLLDAPERLVEVRVLSPVAVSRAHQHRGIGSALVQRGIDKLTNGNVPAVFLEGDPAYYARFGFVPAGPLGFRKPSLRIPDAAFQVLRLPPYADWMTGTLVYSDPFWRHDAVGLRDSQPE